MIRFYNARVLTLKDGENILENAEVVVDGSKIAYVGKTRENVENAEYKRQIDLNGNLIMPGFKNAHTHSAMTFGRSLSDDMPLQDWLYNKIFPLEALLLPHALTCIISRKIWRKRLLTRDFVLLCAAL